LNGQSWADVRHSVVYARGSAFVSVMDHSTVVAYGSHKPGLIGGNAPEVRLNDCSSHVWAKFGEIVALSYRGNGNPLTAVGALARHCAPDLRLSYGAILVIAVLNVYVRSQTLWCHKTTI